MRIGLQPQALRRFNAQRRWRRGLPDRRWRDPRLQPRRGQLPQQYGLCWSVGDMCRRLSRALPGEHRGQWQWSRLCCGARHGASVLQRARQLPGTVLCPFHLPVLDPQVAGRLWGHARARSQLQPGLRRGLHRRGHDCLQQRRAPLIDVLHASAGRRDPSSRHHQPGRSGIAGGLRERRAERQRRGNGGRDELRDDV